MARLNHITAGAPALTPNNRIYLYRLLATELGCGKQTFLPAVEEALASDRMGAEDLGFESTRALLEALEEFVKLTVFKGGRIYATVIAQPEWDAALDAAEQGSGKDDAKGGGKGNKPWKRKKADKALKPVRPKRVKRAEPEPEVDTVPEAETAPEVTSTPEVDTAPEVEPTPETAAPTTSVTTPADTVATAPEVLPAQDSASASEALSAIETTTADEAPSAGEPDQDTPKPAFSLTVTYDPYSGIDTETKLESSPVVPERAPQPVVTEQEGVVEHTETQPAESAPAHAPASNAASTPTASSATAPETSAQAIEAPQTLTNSPVIDPASEPSSTPAATPKPAADAAPEPAVSAAPAAPRTAPEVLATYPSDFSEEVYLTSEVIAALCEVLPYGTDVFTLLAEDYTRARDLELVHGTRARAMFPLRIEHADSTDPITVTLKKRSGSSLKWELAAIE